MSTPGKQPDLIQIILAGILDKFKVNNPKVFIAIQLVLMTVAAFLMNCESLGWCAAPLFKNIAIWVNYVLMILIGSRTSSILEQYKGK